MYKIIGADGKEYGPIGADQMRQWIREGRANAQTKVLAEGATEWKPLAEFPEFSAVLPRETGPGIAGGPPPLRPMVTTASARGDVYSQVSGPAAGLIVVAVLNFLSSVASVVMNLMGATLMHLENMPNQPFGQFFSTTAIIISSILSVAIGVVILVGGLKMKKLESHGLAVTASILALLPCTSGCCIIGLPVGIWALVVLFRPEVKSTFH
jgi:hypothetical protein